MEQQHQTRQTCFESGYSYGLFNYLYLIKIESLILVKLPDSGHLEGSQGPSQFQVDDLHGGARKRSRVDILTGVVGGIFRGPQRMLARIV
jgi:hypothetical protein